MCTADFMLSLRYQFSHSLYFALCVYKCACGRKMALLSTRFTPRQITKCYVCMYVCVNVWFRLAHARGEVCRQMPGWLIQRTAARASNGTAPGARSPRHRPDCRSRDRGPLTSCRSHCATGRNQWRHLRPVAVPPPWPRPIAATATAAAATSAAAAAPVAAIAAATATGAAATPVTAVTSGAAGW